MKKIILLLFLLIVTISFSQENQIIEKPKVDERIELLSIVFRLAEAKEYNSKAFKIYTDKIENHFGKYKNHELIEFIKKIREEDGVGFNATMNMAIHLGSAPNFKPLVKFSNSIPEERWKKKNSLKFIKLLRKFYADSECEKFFKENSELYRKTSSDFLPIYNELDLNWYKSFYGKEPNEKFIIVNALGNGTGNYGPDIQFKNGKREVYAIIGTWKVDSLGFAKFDKEIYFSTLLHEFNHSFINYLTEIHKTELEKSGKEIFEVVEEQMNKQSYGKWEIMINESLVRASVIKYMKDHNFEKNEIEEETQEQLNRGFLWINELVIELENYENNRDKYSTLENYMPNLILAFEKYAKEIKTFEKKFDEKRPKVKSIAEFVNNEQEVNNEIKTISINFDRTLYGKGYSINYSKEGKEYFPKIVKVNYSEDKKTIILDVELESNKEYKLIISGKSIKSIEKIPMKDYQINFKTK
ncbi:DUF4932 domain-containing protein [Flavobacterium gelidilacus]|jgi:hypothetical protein|uniref:DUF4932 domain-containing protein n=1 Tax=Flavobacterium gelidilacus TaxID=206041 RepID=UPI0004115061|nr:DUF4932 domain-containing protein [Flavobacterium gelidilacus]